MTGVAALALLFAAGAAPAQVTQKPLAQSVWAVGAFPQELAVDSSRNLYYKAYDSTSTSTYYTLYKATYNGTSYSASVIAQNVDSAPQIAVDSSGNVYTANRNTGYVVKYTLSGGTYTASNLTLPSTAEPVGLAIDSSGNLYLTDNGTGKVVKETLSGGTYTATTLASGLGSAADITVDSSGNVYYVDPVVKSAYKLAYSGGTYTAGATSVSVASYPSHIAVTSTGVIYVGDGTGSTLYQLTPSSGIYTVSTFLSSYGQQGVFVGSGDKIYIASSTGNSIYSLVLGSYGFGSVAVGSSASVTLNYTIGTTPAIGAINVVTTGVSSLDYTELASSTCTTSSLSTSCSVVVNFVPQAPGLRTGAVQFLDASGNVLNTVYLSGYGTGPHLVFGFSSSKVAAYSTTLDGVTLSSNPQSQIAADAAGNLYINDRTGAKLFKYTRTGPGTYTGAQITTSGVSLSVPSTIALDGVGNLYVTNNSTGVNKITPAGVSSTVALGGYTIGSSIGDLATDGSGNLYIADTSNHRIIEVTPTGTASLVSGVTSADSPGGLTVDSSGNVYFADSSNYRLVKVSTLGVRTVLYTFSSLHVMTRLSLDANNNLLFGDEYAGGYYSLNTASLALNTLPISTVCGADTLLQTGAGDFLGSSNACGSVTAYPAASTSGLNFTSSIQGVTSTDSPKSATIYNVGNAALTISVPSSGSNPSVSSSFALGSATTCPSVSYSGTAQTLAANSSCVYSINFTPTAVGAIMGSAIITDNQLNIAGSTQTISLSGTGLAPVTKVAFGTAPTALIWTGGTAGSAITVLEQNSSSVTQASATDSIKLTVSGPGGYSASYTATAVAGVATFSLSPATLTATGSYTYTASVPSNSGITSATGTEVVQDFTISGTPSSVVILPGGTATYTLPIAPVVSGSNYPAAIALTVSGGPSTAINTLSASSVSASAGSTSITLTVAVPDTLAQQHEQRTPWQRYAPVSLAVMALPLLFGKRKRLGGVLRMLLLAAAAFSVVVGVSACNTASGYFGQGVKSYTVTVTGASGSLSHSTSVTLTAE